MRLTARVMDAGKVSLLPSAVVVLRTDSHWCSLSEFLLVGSREALLVFVPRTQGCIAAKLMHCFMGAFNHLSGFRDCLRFSSLVKLISLKLRHWQTSASSFPRRGFYSAALTLRIIGNSPVRPSFVQADCPTHRPDRPVFPLEEVVTCSRAEIIWNTKLGDLLQMTRRLRLRAWL